MDFTKDWSGDMPSGFSDFSNTTIINNSNLTCAVRSLEESFIALPYSTPLLTTVRVIQSIFFLTLMLLGPPLNVMVIVLVAKNKKLQTKSFGIALQIVMMDLLLSLTACLSAFISSAANRWVLGEYICGALGFLLVVITRVRTLLMFVFVLDRFLAVFTPFFYPKRQLKIIVVLSIVSWLFAVAVGIAQLPPLLDCYSFSPQIWMCSAARKCSRHCSIFQQSLLAFFIPVIIVPIILYAILFIKAWRILRVTPSSSMTSNYEKEWKATITFALLFLGVVLVTLPSVITSLVKSVFFKTNENVHPILFVFSTICITVLFLLPITDPIVIMRHQDVKDILKMKKAKLMKVLCPCLKAEEAVVEQFTLETLATLPS